MPARRTQLQELDPNDPFQGLTSKQQLFVSFSFSGLNDVEAYRQAYDASNMTDMSVQGCAREVAAHPLVRAKLKQLQDKRDEQSSLAPLLSIDWVANGIRDIAADKTIKPNVRLAAYIAAGKLRGVNAFGSDPIEQPAQRSVDDIDKQLLAMLRGMVSTIDGQATDITPAKEKAPAVKPGPAGVGRKRKPRGG